jgi:hypothetical protein
MALPPVAGAARPVVIDLETPLAPEVVRGALIDFGPDRPKLWPGITPHLYKVYSVGATEADVQEGTANGKADFWAREHYDWSDPETIRWIVQDSNFSRPQVSYVDATIRPRADGGSHLHIEWNRQGSTTMGKIARFLIVVTGGSLVRMSFVMGLKEIAKRVGLDPDKAVIK